METDSQVTPQTYWSVHVSGRDDRFAMILTAEGDLVADFVSPHDAETIVRLRAIVDAVEKLAEQWEGLQRSDSTMLRHLVTGAMADCAEQVRAALAASSAGIGNPTQAP